MDRKLIFRDPDAEPPPDFDPVEVLVAFTSGENSGASLDEASEIRLAGIASE